MRYMTLLQYIEEASREKRQEAYRKKTADALSYPLSHAKSESKADIRESIFYYIKLGADGDWDAGLKVWSTKTRWKQYQSGKITRAYAVSLALERAYDAAGVCKWFVTDCDPVEIRNLDQIPAILEAAQKKCRERAITCQTIRDILRRVERNVFEYGFLFLEEDITVHYDGGEDFARSYKYVPYSTHFKARFDGEAWEVTEIVRAPCPPRRSWVASAYDSEGRLLCHV